MIMAMVFAELPALLLLLKHHLNGKLAARTCIHGQPDEILMLHLGTCAIHLSNSIVRPPRHTMAPSYG